MKRLTFLFVVLSALLFVPSVFAATPTPTPTPTILPAVLDSSKITNTNCDGPAKPGDPPCVIAPDVADQPIVNNDPKNVCTKDPQTGVVSCAAAISHSWIDEHAE